MRVCVFIALIFTTLLFAESQRSAEVKPVVQEEHTSDGQKAREESRKNSDDEIKINLTVTDFKTLIDAIESSKPEENQRYKHRDTECDDPGLTFTDFTTCKDLQAQQEMARGTSDIRDFTKIGLIISSIGLVLIFFSLVAAIAAARYARQAARNDLTRNEIELEPVLELDVLDMTLATKSCIEIIEKRNWLGRKQFSGGEQTDSAAFQIKLEITNTGKSPAKNVWIECDKENSVSTKSRFTDSEGGKYEFAENTVQQPVSTIASNTSTPSWLTISVRPHPDKGVTVKSATIFGFNIRYTDFSCGADEHKVTAVDFFWIRNSPEIGVNVSGSRKAKNTKHKDYAAYFRKQSSD